MMNMNDNELFEKYPSAKTLLDTMDRIGVNLDKWTERINAIKIVPISPTISPTLSPISPTKLDSTVQEHEWERLGIPKSTYYYRKKKGLI
jgi:hypothetical protein